jgi:hypothetical protein
MLQASGRLEAHVRGNIDMTKVKTMSFITPGPILTSAASISEYLGEKELLLAVFVNHMGQLMSIYADALYHVCHQIHELTVLSHGSRRSSGC